MILKLTILLAALTAFIATPAASAHNGVSYYLALGDSLAAETNATEVEPPFTDQGYADQLAGLKRATIPNAQARQARLPGGDDGEHGRPLPGTRGRGGHHLCRFAQRLAAARRRCSFLHAHKGNVAFVTIDIGANDVFEGVPLPVLQANLASILTKLREAAGPDVPIVGMQLLRPGPPPKPGRRVACRPYRRRSPS